MAIPRHLHGTAMKIRYSERRLALGGSARSSRWRLGRRRSCRGGGGLKVRVKPACVNPAVQRFLLLWIDVSLPDKATESGLYMRSGATTTVVKVQVADSCVQVVPPKQAYHPAAK